MLNVSKETTLDVRMQEVNERIAAMIAEVIRREDNIKIDNARRQYNYLQKHSKYKLLISRNSLGTIYSIKVNNEPKAMFYESFIYNNEGTVYKCKIKISEIIYY